MPSCTGSVSLSFGYFVIGAAVTGRALPVYPNRAGPPTPPAARPTRLLPAYRDRPSESSSLPHPDDGGGVVGGGVDGHPPLPLPSGPEGVAAGGVAVGGVDGASVQGGCPAGAPVGAG